MGSGWLGSEVCSWEFYGKCSVILKHSDQVKGSIEEISKAFWLSEIILYDFLRTEGEVGSGWMMGESWRVVSLLKKAKWRLVLKVKKWESCGSNWDQVNGEVEVCIRSDGMKVVRDWIGFETIGISIEGWNVMFCGNDETCG